MGLDVASISHCLVPVTSVIGPRTYMQTHRTRAGGGAEEEEKFSSIRSQQSLLDKVTLHNGGCNDVVRAAILHPSSWISLFSTVRKLRKELYTGN